VIAILAAGVLSPFFFEATPEVRSAYQSLGFADADIARLHEILLEDI